jgi:phosphohistidine phosphatase
LVVSSTAVRALTTAELAADAGKWSCPIVTDEALYGSDPEGVLKVIAATEPDIDRLLITGHEPTWSVLVTWLIGGGRVHMPTAAVACLDQLRGDWTDVGPGTCELRWLVTPKMLKGK